MGSIRACLLQVGMLFGVNKGLSVTSRHVIWCQSRYMGSIKTCLLQGYTLNGVKKYLSHKKAR